MNYRHRTTRDFRALFAQLPLQVQQQAKEKHKLLIKNPSHPSLHFKPVGGYESVRINLKYRALGMKEENSDGIIIWWIWIGDHEEYDELLKMGA